MEKERKINKEKSNKKTRRQGKIEYLCMKRSIQKVKKKKQYLLTNQ